MVLSYVTIGAVLAPTLHLDRLLLALIAYFLGLGIAAHALNELHERHWGDSLSRAELAVLFFASLTLALSIGVYGSFSLYTGSQPTGSVVLICLITVETIFLLGYNTGKAMFHSDLAFAFSWATLPCLISYFANALTFSVGVILVALGAGATAMIEINLSRWCKEFRRKGISEVKFNNGISKRFSTPALIEKPERALQLIVVTVDLLGLGLVVWRLVGG